MAAGRLTFAISVLQKHAVQFITLLIIIIIRYAEIIPALRLSSYNNYIIKSFKNSTKFAKCIDPGLVGVQ